MTIQELYDWAKENNRLNYELSFVYTDPETYDTIDADLDLENTTISDKTEEMIFS